MLMMIIIMIVIMMIMMVMIMIMIMMVIKMTMIMMQAGRLLPAGDVDGRGVIALCRLDAAAILSSLEDAHGVRFGFRG